MISSTQSVEGDAGDLEAGKGGAGSPSDRSPRSSAAALRRRLMSSVAGADVAAVVVEVVRLSLDRSGAPRDQLAACRLLLEYAVGKPGAVEGDGAAAGPRFVFQFNGPVIAGVEGGPLRPSSVGLLVDQDDPPRS